MAVTDVSIKGSCELIYQSQCKTQKNKVEMRGKRRGGERERERERERGEAISSEASKLLGILFIIKSNIQQRQREQIM